jgi:hypothetical protein
MDNLTLLKSIVTGQEAKSEDALTIHDPDDIQRIVELNCTGSPKLR